MNIYLIHLINQFNFGGSTTFLIHLYEQFKNQGYNPIIIKRGNKRRVIKYYHIDVTYLKDDEILYIAKKNLSIITYCFYNENGDLAAKLIRNGVPLIVHDPAEYHKEWIDIAKNYDNTIVIREKNKNNLKELGVKSTFIPHPYIRANANKIKNKTAVCPTRIDFRKHTEIICRYNSIYKDKIKMYGEINRLFAYHVLDQKYNGWKENYISKIDAIFGEQVNIISEYQYSIDLTAIKNDGGGTQYCFFEAWDAGCTLILNKKWDIGYNILKNNENCLFINDEKDINNIIKNNITYDKDAALKILDNHKSEIIIPQYIKLLK